MAKTTMTPTALAASGLTIIDVDPSTLGVDDQVRADATPDDDLVASVRRFGVLQPPTVYWDADREKYIVIIGHRRVGAAIVAKLPTIQALVRDAEAARDALRLEQQLVENERREQLTPADVARGYKDMEMFGLRPEDIAAAVADRPERVTAALKATRSPKAAEAMVKGIDFEQAAIIADFDDHPDIQERLAEVAVNNPGNFAYKAQEAQADAAAAVRVAELEEQLRIDGCPLIQKVRWNDTWWNGDGKTVPNGQGRALERMDINRRDHTACPGHAAIIHNTSSEKYAGIVYVCTDFKGNGHDQEPALTEEQLAQQEERARQQEEARKKQEAYDANATARREWLRGFITGRLNQTAGIFDLIADAVVGAAEVDQVQPVEPATLSTAVFILTGEKHTYSYADTPLADMLADGRVTALRALVAIALAACEEYAARPSQARGYAPRLVAKYFDHLKNWGYTFSDLDTEIHGEAIAGVAELEDVDVDDQDDEEDAA